MNKKLIEINAAIIELTAKVAIVQSDAANLRGQFNRKVAGLKPKEEEGKKEGVVFLAPDGSPIS